MRSYRPWFWAFLLSTMTFGGGWLVNKKVSLPNWLNQRSASEGKSVAGVKIEAPLTVYQSDQFKFTLKYPEGFVVGQISPEDQKKDPLMAKLIREEPPTLVLFWEEGLGMLNALIKKPTLEYLREQVDRRYSIEYKDFQKEKVEDTTLSGLPAFSVWFTFQDPDRTYREKIKLTVTTKDGKDYYLQCMAPVVMWEKAELSCNIIRENFQFLP